MKVIKVLLGITGVALLAAIIVLFAAPTHLHMERKITIHAPQATVWQHIVLFKNFNQWNAWGKLDSAAQYTITGQDGAVGAVDSWQGEKVGEGKLEHIKLEPYKKVQQKLSFAGPSKSTADVFFHLKEEKGQTVVTWGVDSDFPRPLNVISLLLRGSLERDYDAGLAALKRQAEADTMQY